MAVGPKRGSNGQKLCSPRVLVLDRPHEAFSRLNDSSGAKFYGEVGQKDEKTPGPQVDGFFLPLTNLVFLGTP